VNGSGVLVLYLDLDGVVHHHAVYQGRRGIHMSVTESPGRSLFEWADVLAELLRPFPSVHLVLSSSWCRRPGYARTIKRLPPELRARFIGGTFHRRLHGPDPGAEIEFASLPRGVQVINDVARRRPRDWLALDDDDRGWPAEHRGHLVLCNGELGISDPTTQQELTKRLSNMVYPIAKPTWNDDARGESGGRLSAVDMVSIGTAAQLLSVTGDALDNLIRARQLLAIRAPGQAWHLPVWQFEEPLRSLMPQILRALDLDGYGALAWLETPQGGLQGLTPRAAVERGYGAKVVQLALAEGT